MNAYMKQNLALSNCLELAPTSSSLDLIFPWNAFLVLLLLLFYYQLSRTTSRRLELFFVSIPAIDSCFRLDCRKKISPRDNILAAN